MWINRQSRARLSIPISQPVNRPASRPRPRKVASIASIDFSGYSVVCLLPENRSSSLLTIRRDPRIRKLRAELAKTRTAHPSRAEPLRGAKPGGAEFRMSRTNSSVRLQGAGLVGGDPGPAASIKMAAAATSFRCAE
jgi:hypothetical protein